MNNRSRKTKGLSHRLIALLLCCVCLLAAMPAYAIALEPGAAPAAGETAAENPAEEAAAGSADAAVYTGPEAALTADTLYARLMACTTYEEMEAIINALSEEERLLLDQFTEEQKAALEAKKSELSTSAAEPSSEAATEPTAQENTAPTGTGETTAPTAAEGTTEPTGETEATASTEPTEATEATEVTAPSAETDPTEETAAGSEADALFARLMAYETFEELDAALNSLTEDEQALLDQFTEEQNAALEARMKELGGYAIDILVSYNGTLTITDSITKDGCLHVSADDLAAEQTATYVWEKSTDNQNWTEVTREKVTGDLYNVDENGLWVNVALDGGARCYYRVKIVKIDEATVDKEVYSAPKQVTYYDALQNGSFETPAVSGGMQLFVDSGANGIVWKTTASDGQIELVNPENDRGASFRWHSVYSAAEGKQCAEINANGEGALYQDVLTVPGSTMYWQLSHLGRSRNSADRINGTDTMYVLIMPYESAQDITTQAQVQQVLANLSAYPGAEVEKITYTWQWVTRTENNSSVYVMQHLVDGVWVDTFEYSGDRDGDTYYNQVANPWEVHSGKYKVPDGQYLTRYFFVSGSTASGDVKIGNHIDHVHFSTELPEPNPGSANLTIKKTIEVEGWGDMTEEEQQKFKEAVSFTYGDNTSVSGTNMEWIGNVGTYQVNIGLGTSVSKDITVTEELKKVDGYVWGGTEENKTQTVALREGGKASAEFVNHYTVANKTLTIRKTVSGNMYNENDKFKFTVSYDGQTAATFELGNNDEGAVSIPIGATVTVAEERGEYICTVKSVDPGSLVYESLSGNNGLTFTMPASDVTVVINNEKSVIVDTGVILDTLPYVLILAVVVVGVVLLMKKRRYRDED